MIILNMLIYNVTTGLDKKIEQEWIAWMKEVHIPEVMKTKIFVSKRLYKVLTSDDQNMVSYAVQYTAQSLGQLEKYLEEFAPALRDKVKERFGSQLASFRTVLEEIS